MKFLGYGARHTDKAGFSHCRTLLAVGATEAEVACLSPTEEVNLISAASYADVQANRP